MCAKAVFKHSQILSESDQQRWNKGRPFSIVDGNFLGLAPPACQSKTLMCYSKIGPIKHFCVIFALFATRNYQGFSVASMWRILFW